MRSTITFMNASDEQFHHVILADFGTNDPELVEENMTALLDSGADSLPKGRIDMSQVNFDPPSPGLRTGWLRHLRGRLPAGQHLRPAVFHPGPGGWSAARDPARDVRRDHRRDLTPRIVGPPDAPRLTGGPWGGWSPPSHVGGFVTGRMTESDATAPIDGQGGVHRLHRVDRELSRCRVDNCDSHVPPSAGGHLMNVYGTSTGGSSRTTTNAPRSSSSTRSITWPRRAPAGRRN